MPITLTPMTLELCHQLYQNWENDPAIYGEDRAFQPYVYDGEAVSKRFAKQQISSRCYLAILLNEQIIGEILLKDINREVKRCTLSIHLQNDSVKGKGYGTKAEQLAIDYAFHQLGMETISADVLRQNTRSRHIVEKLGFRKTHEEGQFLYYELHKA